LEKGEPAFLSVERGEYFFAVDHKARKRIRPCAGKSNCRRQENPPVV
jgi:hypothetical protein